MEEKLSAIKDFEAGMKVVEVCRKHNVNPNTLYKLKAKYDEAGVGGLAPKVIRTVTTKELQHRREKEELKKLLGEKELAIKMYKGLLKKRIPA